MKKEIKVIAAIAITVMSLWVVIPLLPNGPAPALGFGRPIVYIAPHPDDELAGAYSIHELQSADTWLIVVTDSKWQGWDRDPLPSYEIRRNETLAAAGLIGFDHVVFLGFDEFEFDAVPMEEVKDALRPYIEMMPSRVYIPSAFDAQFHPDHAKVRQAVLELIDGQSLIHVWVWTYHMIDDNHYGDYVTSPEICELKVEIFGCYRSQWWPISGVHNMRYIFGESVHEEEVV